MLLLIDNYDSFTWNLAQYFGELGCDVRVERNDALTVDAVAALRPDQIVVSPGPCTPNEAGISLDVIRRFAGVIPLLGVCLGHQCIGQAFGGRVVRAPRLMHGKTSKVFHDDRGLYAGVANPFVATRYHSLVIEPGSMPDALEVSAKTWEDEIMGVRHRGFAGGPAVLEGVQFHPESILTTVGKQLLANFLTMAGMTLSPAARAAAARASGASEPPGSPVPAGPGSGR